MAHGGGPSALSRDESGDAWSREVHTPEVHPGHDPAPESSISTDRASHLKSPPLPTMRVSRQKGTDMLVLLIVLLVLWLILAVVGFAIEGLMWLAIIGIILFVGTVAIGIARRKAVRR